MSTTYSLFYSTLPFGSGFWTRERRSISHTATVSKELRQNMNITFASNYGNFEYEMSLTLQPDIFRPFQTIDETSTMEEKEVDKSERAVLATMVKLWQQGLANIAYRVAGSAVDKALGVETGKGKEGRRGVKFDAIVKIVDKDGNPVREVNAEGVAVRKEQFARDIIEETVNQKLQELGKKEGSDVPAGITFRITGQHEYGAEGESAMVRASAFVDALQSSPASRENMVTMFLTLGLEKAETASRDELIAFAHGKGLGISAKKGK